MKNNKAKKLLLALAIGIGLSIAGLAHSAPNESVCRYLDQQCDAGSQTACISYGKWCARYP